MNIPVDREVVKTINIDQTPVYAYKTKGFEIYNPFFSECGRFEVDPFDYYGLTKAETRFLIDLNNHHGYDWAL